MLENNHTWHDMPVSNYEPTSNSNDGRNDRLNKTIGYICALSEHYGNSTLVNKISNLHDHKGYLEVHHLVDLTDGEKEWFYKAWNSGIGDGCSNVEFRATK